MADCRELVEMIKTAAAQTMDAEKPIEILFGTVTTASPLSVSIDQKFTVGAAQLILSRSVTNYTTTMNITGAAASAGAHRHTVPDSADTTGEAGNHAHDLAGPYTVQVMNGLRQGERVILARLSGGQRYLVLDRIGGGAA